MLLIIHGHRRKILPPAAGSSLPSDGEVDKFSRWVMGKGIGPFKDCRAGKSVRLGVIGLSQHGPIYYHAGWVQPNKAMAS